MIVCLRKVLLPDGVVALKISILVTATAELAVITLAPAEEANIDARCVWPDPLVFVAGPEHPLCDGPQPTLGDLSNYANVLPGLDTYAGQIVTFTFPHIGNTGTNAEDEESTAVWAAGLVIRDLPLLASNYRNGQ